MSLTIGHPWCWDSNIFPKKKNESFFTSVFLCCNYTDHILFSHHLWTEMVLVIGNDARSICTATNFIHRTMCLYAEKRNSWENHKQDCWAFFSYVHLSQILRGWHTLKESTHTNRWSQTEHDRCVTKVVVTRRTWMSNLLVKTPRRAVLEIRLRLMH